MIGYLEAKPISRAELEELGWRFRVLVGADADRWLPVERIVEHSLPKLLGDEYCFEVRPTQEMGTRHGLTEVGGKRLVLREDVYDGLVRGHGRDRMTAVHEIAHLILHPEPLLSRRLEAGRPPAYRDPEWQAKCLAGTIMMPHRMVGGLTSVSQIAAEFGVSGDAAAYRAKQLRMEVTQ